MLRYLVILASFIVLTGCSSTLLRVKPHCMLCDSSPYYPYSGTLADAHLMSFCLFSNDCGFVDTQQYLIFVPYGIIDLPFSFVLDTMLLPVDTYNLINKDK